MNKNENEMYKPGDLVCVRHEIEKPVMVVKNTEYKYEKDKRQFKGVLCWWFDKNLQKHEDVFNTKDLIFYTKPQDIVVEDVSRRFVYSTEK